MTVEELLTMYNILVEKANDLYLQQQEAWDTYEKKHAEIMADPKTRLEEDRPLREKYNLLFDEASKASEALEAFKKLEWGCVREEKRDNLRAFR